jgi:hypothetical protein
MSISRIVLERSKIKSFKKVFQNIFISGLANSNNDINNYQSSLMICLVARVIKKYTFFWPHFDMVCALCAIWSGCYAQILQALTKCTYLRKINFECEKKRLK